MKLLLARVLRSTAICFVATSVHSETQCTSVVIPMSPTNWSTSVSVPRFDPNGKLLREVRVAFSGAIQGAIGIESMSPAPQTLTGHLNSRFDVLDPSSALLFGVVVSAPTQTFVLGAFDGTVDFGGTSGAFVSGLTGANQGSIVLTHPSGTSSLFVGPPGNPGTLFTPVSAIGLSYFAGNNGNEVAQFVSSGGGTLDVCYVFDRDCNGNLVADQTDIANGTSFDTNGNGVPDECDYTITGGLCAGDGSGAACPCGNTSAPGGGAGCNHSLGSGGLLVGSGVARISADTVLLSASALPPTSSTLFFQGTTTLGNDLGAPFGDGLRCAGGTIRRLATLTAQNGMAAFPPAGSPGVAAEGAVTPGTRTYQVWFRNAAAFCTPSTFNLTNGVRILWGV